MKKFSKVFFVIAILLCIFVYVPNETFAAHKKEADVMGSGSETEVSPTPNGKTDNFNFSKFDNEQNESVNNATKNVLGTVITVIRTVATGVSIVMLTYVAIRYMSSAPQEKADFKKSATIYVVGAVLVFGATQIFAVIAGFAGNVLTTVN